MTVKEIIELLDKGIREYEEEIVKLKNAKKELRGGNSAPRQRKTRQTNKPGHTLLKLREFASEHEIFTPAEAGKAVGNGSYTSALLRKHSDIAEPEETGTDGRVRLYRSKLYQGIDYHKTIARAFHPTGGGAESSE